MFLIPNAILYILIFLSVYVQVFFLVTFLENRNKIIIRKGKMKLQRYPTVTIVVPAFNEEKTVYKTVQSLLDLNYPQDKLNLFLIDDGSTDGTFDVMRSFSKYSNIKVFRKENGGKHTALNLGLENSGTEFFGALDADSFADPESLIRIMSCFERDSSIMAVAPCIVVSDSKNLLQNIQREEYHMGIYFKKMLGFLGAISVTPGPLAIFRTKVFDDLGPYRHGHNSEDMEIACRMQKNYYKIEYCNDAYVYTSTPQNIKNLYKQRLRWMYGLINNTIDYRDVLFKKKYGNFAFFTLPMGLISIFSVSYLFGHTVYNFSHFLYSKILILNTVGFNFNIRSFYFDSFFLNTQSFVFLVFSVYAIIVFSMIFGRKMAKGKWGFSLNMIYFFPVFSLLAPFWLVKAVYNTILQRKPSWR